MRQQAWASEGLLCVRQICFVTMALLNSLCVLMSIINLVFLKDMLDLSVGEGSLKNPPTHPPKHVYVYPTVSQSVLKTILLSSVKEK